MPVWLYTLIPVAAMILGAAVTIWRRPGPAMTSGVQHLAAGVVFAAAAGELLPDLKRAHSPGIVLIGGLCGVAVMLIVKQLGKRAKGQGGLVAITAVDIFIDGLVLGIGFVAAARTGLLLTIALTLEVLFLGVTVAIALSEDAKSRLKVVAAVGGIGLLLPLGSLLGGLASGLPHSVITGLFAFGLIALLYLVTEELLVEAHERPEGPIVTSMFFIGFLALLDSGGGAASMKSRRDPQ